MMPKRFPFDPLAFTLGIAREFGDIVHYKLASLHVYYVNHPELAREILVEQPEKFYKARLVKLAFRPFAGDGLVTSDGALWKRQRKLMQPAFQHHRLTSYGDIMVAHTERLMDSFADGEVRNIGAEMTKLTLGIVVRSLFGEELPREAGDLSRSLMAVLDAANQRLSYVLQIPQWVPTPRNLREKRAVAELDGILRFLIRTRRDSGESRDDLLSALLSAVDEANGTGMSDQQLRDEMMTLFFAGHDTTANALTWTWYLLARHQEVAAKLAEELQQVLAGRAPSVNDLPKLPYTEMVIREVIRLYPPAAGVAREPIEDMKIAGYDLPKGSLIVVSTYAMHRDERFFPDPERYDPERFAPGWEERIPRYAYLPFGSGPRVCIGSGFALMEARLILATLARRFKLSLETDEEVRPVQLVTVKPSAPVRMRVERR
jgi:cytochrome P450